LINVSVYLTQSLVNSELVLKDKNVVVIDTLRATSTMITALASGAKEIVPAESATVAARIAKGSANSLLCGERNGKIIEGFDLGNSPFEYTPEKVKGKSLVFCTTNGTVSIKKAKHSKSCVLGGFINFTKVVEYLSNLKEDFIILCSGKLNHFCTEDVVTAGLILSEVITLGTFLGNKNNYSIGDSEYVSIKLGKLLSAKNGKPDYDRILDMQKKSEHGKYLMSIGFGSDLEFCSKIDSHPYLPVFRSGVFKLKESFDSEASDKSKMRRINISNKTKDTESR